MEVPAVQVSVFLLREVSVFHVTNPHNIDYIVDFAPPCLFGDINSTINYAETERALTNTIKPSM